MTWAETSRRVILEEDLRLRKDIPDVDERLSFISRTCYPFGERMHWPYKAWLKEIAKRRKSYEPKKIVPQPVDENQTELF